MTPASLLQHDAFLSPLAIDEAVQRALDEDLGRAGDITSIATIPESTSAHAIMVARQSGVIAGLPLAVAIFQKLSPDIASKPMSAMAARLPREPMCWPFPGPHVRYCRANAPR